MLSENANQDRFLYLSGSMLIAIAGSSGTLVMMLCTEAVLVKSIPGKKKVLFAAMLLIAFGLYFSLVTRMPLVRTFIYMAVISHYMRKQISFRSILILSSVIVLFFLFGTLVRADVVEFSDLAMRLDVDVPMKYIPFVNPYAYAINNIWNMDFGFRKFIDGMNAYTLSYGFEMFRGMFFFTNLEAIMQGAYGFDSLYNESVVKVHGLNTVLYIWHLYKDFGVAGLFLISIVLSTMIHLFYYNTLLAPSHVRTALFSLIISMMAFSFMVPLWSFWNIYYEAAMLLLAHKTIKIV
jgi:oligosaccharide repeat unit polymerase